MTAGIRHDEMRRRNRLQVIAAVRRADRPSRTEIARLTGLSHSTISAISADLIEEGIMREVPQGEATPSRRGRPQVAIGLNPDAAWVACLHLSFNSLTAVLADYCGTVIASRSYRLQTLTLDRRALMEAAVRALHDIAAGHERLLRIAFAVQGITDAAGRELMWSPITPHTHLRFAPMLEEAFGVPVTVQNDCNMIAAALRWRHPARYGDNFIAILLSQGIGMGLMLDGRLFTGTRSSAGEFGHMTHRPEGARCRCGRLGCIEAYAGNYAIWRRALGFSVMAEPVADVEVAEMEALAETARREDGPARQAFREAADALGFGIGSLFALLDPAPVAIVGHGTKAFDILEPEIRAALARTAGGQHADAASFETFPDEVPFIQHGCAMTALTNLDRDMSGAGLRGANGKPDGGQSMIPESGRQLPNKTMINEEPDRDAL